MRVRILWKVLILSLLGLLLAISPMSISPMQLASASVGSPQSFDPTSQLTQGREYYAAGRFADAVSAWQAAVAAYAASGNRSQQALSLSYLSLAHQALSQWDMAQTTIESSLALLDQSPEATIPILWAQALNTQGSLRLAFGQPESALEIWEHAQNYYEQAGDTFGAIGSQINQAQAFQQLGFYRRSRKRLEALRERLSTMPDSDLKVTALRNLGTTMQRMGDYRDSYTVFEQGLAISNRINATSQRNAILLNIGKLAADLDEYETALTYFEQVEQNAVAPSEQWQASVRRLAIYVEQNNGQLAQALLPQVLNQLAELSPNRSSIYGTLNLANTISQVDAQHRLLSAHDLSQLLADTVQAAQELQDFRAEAYGLQQLGRLYGQNGQETEAVALTQQARRIAQTYQARKILAQSAWQLGQLLEKKGQDQAAIAAYREAIEALQSLRGDLIAVGQDVQFSFRNSVEPVYRELIGLLLNDNPKQENLSEARQLIEDLQLAELDDFFRQACLDVQPEQIDQLDPQATIIYPIILPDQLAVITSQVGQPLEYYTTPVSQTVVEAKLYDFLRALHPSSDTQEQLQVAQEIYDWLIRPIEQRQPFSEGQTLVFVLDGLLRNIPMAALYDGKNYLIEKFAVALSPGLQLAAPRSLDTSNLQAVVGGISEARSGFSALPEVESEVEDISQMVDTAPLLNQDFTILTISEQLQDSSADVVHLATHGQFSSNQEDTFLLMWEERINVWQLAEILQRSKDQRRQGIELLVLSACNTASGDNRAVLGLAGLAVKSGARSTLATLWSVRDQAAALLMKSFYGALQEPDVTKAEALRKAQLTLLSDNSYQKPFFWSAYVLVGNWL